MANKTKIEWCDATWNPVTGCHYHCKYCYARRIATRFFGGKQPCVDIHILDKPFTMEGKATPYPFGFTPTFHRYRLDEPAQWKEPKNVFVCSMADLFGEWVPNRVIEEVFAACERAPQHRYLFLTKNPDRYIRLAQMDKLPQKNNMWYGTTVPTEDTQFFYAEEFDNFISIEPIMGEFFPSKNGKVWADWVIIGAETGNSNSMSDGDFINQLRKDLSLNERF